MLARTHAPSKAPARPAATGTITDSSSPIGTVTATDGDAAHA